MIASTRLLSSREMRSDCAVRFVDALLGFPPHGISGLYWPWLLQLDTRRELMRNHLKHCASAAIRAGEPAEAEAMYDELVDMMYKHSR
jgi:hypothetical protein